MITNCYPLVYTYVNGTCCHLSKGEEKFKKILSQNVKLSHKTNNEETVHAEGKEKVISLFKKYIFDNTSYVHILSTHCENFKIDHVSSVDLKSGIFLTLVVEEDKTEEVVEGKEQKVVNKYRFEEKTYFEFDEKQEKITSINTFVKRVLLV